MKKILRLFIFSLILLSLFSLKLSLKEEVFIKENNLKMNDIINETIPISIGNIPISEITFFPYKLKNSEVLNIFFKNGFYEITLSGKESIIYLGETDIKESKEESVKEDKKIQKPLDFLEEYLSNFIDKNNFKIKISLTKIEPSIELDSVNEEYKWEINKLNVGLKDIVSLKKISFLTNNNKYTATIDVNINADIWISKAEFFKRGFFQERIF